MVYTGFNEKELKLITEILNRNGVHYQVSVPGKSLDFINDPTKRVDHRFMDNLLQVEIDDSEFEKINAKDIQKLFDLRIYKEEESPFSEEELAGIDEEMELKTKKPDPNAKINQVAAIMAIGTVIAFYLWKQGMFR